MLSLSEIEYICDFSVYTGKAEDDSDLGLCTEAVVDLMESLRGVGHVVCTDNFYTSPKLYLHLLEHQIYACGTCRPSRENFPKMLAVKYLPEESKHHRVFTSV